VLVIVLSSLVPIAVWYGYVRARYGSIPILDPYLRVRTSTVELPFVGIWHSLAKTSGESLVTAIVIAALVPVALAMWHRSILGTIAAASALQILSAGPFSFRFIGEAVRTTCFLQLFLVLALIAIRWPLPQAVDDVGST
jgi:hypothetical protein